MKIKKQLEHKITGGRNSSCRKIVVSGNKIYVGFLYDKESFYESLIQCLDADDFTVLWEYSYRHVMFSMFISQHDTLIVNFMGGQVKALGPDSGHVLWEFDTEGKNTGVISNEVDGKVVFSGIQKAERSWCIDTANGKILWEQPNSGHAYVPVIHDGRVYTTIGNEIFCAGFSDGLPVWKNTEPETYLTNLHIFKHAVIATGHGVFNFYDLQTGKLLGTANTGIRKAIGWMVSDDHSIYFGDEGGFFYCYRIDMAGDEVKAALAWKIEAKPEVRRAPVVEGDRLYIAVENFGFLCVASATGEILLERKVKGEGSFLALEGNRIYFAGKMSLFQFAIQ